MPKWLKEYIDEGRKPKSQEEREQVLGYIQGLRQKGDVQRSEELFKLLLEDDRSQNTELEGVETVSMEKSNNEIPYYVGLAISNPEGSILIGKRKEDGIWTGPGGGGNYGESPKDCAKREAFEESGIILEDHQLVEMAPTFARNGKTVYRYYAQTMQPNTTSNLDPDNEVSEWIWVSPDEVTEDMKKDERRYKTILEGFMMARGIKKSFTQEQTKAHMEEALKYSELNRKLKEKVLDRKKLNKDYKTPGKAQDLEKDCKEGYKYHRDQYRSLNESLMKEVKELQKKKIEKGGPGSGPGKGSNKRVPINASDMKTMALQNYESKKNWEKQYKKTGSEHAKKMVEIFTEKFNKLKPYFKKSVVSVDSQGSAIETANFALESQISPQVWLDAFYDQMKDYNYGDAPRTIYLDRGFNIMLSKVDDGLYSGYIRQTIDWDGDSPLQENVGKVEKQTIPAIIQYLTAKEYISLEESNPTNLDEAEELEQIIDEPVEIIPTNHRNEYLVNNLVNLLNKLLD